MKAFRRGNVGQSLEVIGDLRPRPEPVVVDLTPGFRRAYESDRRKGKRAPSVDEVAEFVAILGAMGRLDDDGRRRVLAYLDDLYGRPV